MTIVAHLGATVITLKVAYKLQATYFEPNLHVNDTSKRHTNVTDGRTDRQTTHDGNTLCTAVINISPCTSVPALSVPVRILLILRHLNGVAMLSYERRDGWSNGVRECLIPTISRPSKTTQSLYAVHLPHPDTNNNRPQQISFDLGQPGHFRTLDELSAVE